MKTILRLMVSVTFLVNMVFVVNAFAQEMHPDTEIIEDDQGNIGDEEVMTPEGDETTEEQEIMQDDTETMENGDEIMEDDQGSMEEGSGVMEEQTN